MMTVKQEELVSIIVPVYNAEIFLADTIMTIRNQTYSNWEAIFVDDGSQDESVAIIKKHQEEDARLKLLLTDVNSGAALARNKAILQANGKYLAFLDADDFWEKTKLQKQVAFMSLNKAAFCFTGYEFTDSSGKPNGKKVSIPTLLNYRQALRNTIIWTSTVMFNLEKISKQQILMPNVKSEDMATWWAILRKGYIAYGLNEVLSYYRRSENTLSSNKLEAIKRVWNLYRQIERLGLAYSFYNFCGYALNTVKKRL